MKQKLIQYVDLLFAGSSGTEDVKQEILQNTLDRYDDLLAQGKSPEAAYSLAISSIGDIHELLGQQEQRAGQMPVSTAQKPDAPKKLPLRPIAVCLYIISMIPLIVLSEFGLEIIGLCLTLLIVGIATALIMLAPGSKKEPAQAPQQQMTPKQQMKKAINGTISTVGLVVYFVVSFATGAWMITWLIFPITGAVQGIASAVLDLKEENKHEN